MKSLDLNLLFALDALLAEGSVSGAARAMHLSTPAMSHALARIRDVVGDPLLVRAGRALVPTPRAMEMREPVRRLVTEARALLLPGEGAPLAGLKRVFTIRASHGIAMMHGTTMLRVLHETMPLASLRFVPDSDDSVALREARIDIDIGTLHEKAPDVVYQPLYEHRYVGVVRSGHPILRKRRTARLFAEQQHVALTQRGRTQESVDAALAAAGYRREVVLTVPGVYNAVMAAAHSDLVATVPVRSAQSVAQTLDLKSFALPFDVPVDQVVQAWHARLDSDPAHRVLRQCVQRALTGQVPPLRAFSAEDQHLRTLSQLSSRGRKG